MKIYLASRYSRREELLGYRADLVALGHEVTARWLDGNHQLNGRGLSVQGEDRERMRFATEDLDDVKSSDLVISFTEVPRSMNDSRGGRHVEFGLALGCEIPAWVVGPRENVFHCLPWVWQFDDWAGALAELRSGQFAIEGTESE